MIDHPELDFDRSNIELQNRLRWAENAKKERDFWTPERRLVSWMNGTTPDESDLRWLAAQPSYTRELWIWLMEREANRCRTERAAGRVAIRREFHIVLAEFEENAAINQRADDSLIERFVEWIREDFLAGRPCSVSIENAFPRWRAERCLKEAIRIAGIPTQCLKI